MSGAGTLAGVVNRLFWIRCEEQRDRRQPHQRTVPGAGELKSVQTQKSNFPVDAFTGTAGYYVDYRVPYPEELLRNLVMRANISSQARLLDLACGPGRACLALSSWFQEVWAIDLEPEMIEVGRKQATERGIKNVEWFIGRAEELVARANSFELITIGEAFHRLDRPQIAKQAIHWLKPAGCLAIIGCDVIIQGKEPWQGIVADVVERFTRRTFSTDEATPKQSVRCGPDYDEAILREAGFQEVGSYRFLKPYVWTPETIIGNLYSTSFCSKRVLGDKSQAFEADLNTALLAHDERGTYWENMRFGFTLGKKPIGE